MFIKENVKNTRYYINKYGIFYEGQLLYRYLWNNNVLYYNDEVILDKFIIHYRNREAKLFCRIFLKDSSRKTDNYYTINVNQLGVNYKIKII